MTERNNVATSVSTLRASNCCVTEGRTVSSTTIQSLNDLSTLWKKVTGVEILWALRCMDAHFSGHWNVGH